MGIEPSSVITFFGYLILVLLLFNFGVTGLMMNLLLRGSYQCI
jgi:hypothetical protein